MKRSMKPDSTGNKRPRREGLRSGNRRNIANDNNPQQPQNRPERCPCLPHMRVGYNLRRALRAEMTRAGPGSGNFSRGGQPINHGSFAGQCPANDEPFVTEGPCNDDRPIIPLEQPDQQNGQGPFVGNGPVQRNRGDPVIQGMPCNHNRQIGRFMQPAQQNGQGPFAGQNGRVRQIEIEPMNNDEGMRRFMRAIEQHGRRVFAYTDGGVIAIEIDPLNNNRLVGRFIQPTQQNGQEPFGRPPPMQNGAREPMQGARPSGPQSGQRPFGSC